MTSTDKHSGSDDSGSEVRHHAIVVAALAVATGVVEKVNNTDWATVRWPELLLHGLSVAFAGLTAFLIVYWISQQSYRNRRILEDLRKRQPAALPEIGTVDGIWVGLVWQDADGKDQGKAEPKSVLKGASVFAITSSESEGFKLTGKFYGIENGTPDSTAKGRFQGNGRRIDSTSFAFKYSGHELPAGDHPAAHHGGGYYNFYGKQTWEHTDFDGYFLVEEPKQVRRVSGEKLLGNTGLELESTEVKQHLIAFVKREVGAHWKAPSPMQS